MASLSEPEDPSPKVYISQEWSEATNSIVFESVASSAPVVLICGPKNCGKSTFSRHLLNILLQRYRKVAYLDTDVGQPEFTPPGFVSVTALHKVIPDLTVPCLKTPERCFFFGDISSKRDPTTYLSYITALYDYYQKEYYTSNNIKNYTKCKLPLIVNTPGWVKGIGYNILVDFLKYIDPTHVVKINISAKNKNLPSGAFWLAGYDHGMVNLIEINSARQDSFDRSVLVHKDAQRLRDLRVMDYFKQCFPISMKITTCKELAHALASYHPYEVPISSLKIRHLYCQIPSTDIFYSLNATIVGLAISSEQSDNLPWCVGLGIVRGIDTSKGLLYVITPVLPNTLERVNLLLQGFIQIPTRLLQVKGYESPYMSTNVLSTS